MRKDAMAHGDLIAFWPAYQMPKLRAGLAAQKRVVKGMMQVEIVNKHHTMKVSAGRYTSATVEVSGILVRLVNQDDADSINTSMNTDFKLARDDGTIELRNARRLIMPWSEWEQNSAELRAQIEDEERADREQEERQEAFVAGFRERFGFVPEYHGPDDWYFTQEQIEVLLVFTLPYMPDAAERDLLRKFALKSNHRPEQEGKAREILRRMFGTEVK